MNWGGISKYHNAVAPKRMAENELKHQIKETLVIDYDKTITQSFSFVHVSNMNFTFPNMHQLLCVAMATLEASVCVFEIAITVTFNFGFALIFCCQKLIPAIST